MMRKIMGGEVFKIKKQKQYLKTGISYGMNRQGEPMRNIQCEYYEDEEFLKPINFCTYEETLFDEVHENDLVFIKKLTDEEHKRKIDLFQEEIRLAKKGNKESYLFLEAYYKKIFDIRIENEGYDSENHPLSREEILEAGMKGFKKALDDYNESLGRYETLIRQYGDREMISAIKRSVRKRKI